MVTPRRGVPVASVSRGLRIALHAAKDLFVTAGPIALIAVALLAAAYWVLDPMPPKVVTLATGQTQGAYAEFGRRYAAWMRRHGIEVRLQPTQGAAHNLALLRDPGSGVDVAFVQGGADTAEQPAPGRRKDDGLEAIGALFHEPVWLFYREDAAQRLLGRPTLGALPELRGWRLNVGVPGSGVPNLTEKLFKANRIEPSTLTLVHLDETPAVMALLEARLDALVFASAPESPLVQMLLQTPGIALFDFAHSEAYARRFPFVAPVLLPRGIVDLARDLPSRDVRLIAPTAMLVTREDTHPALVQLFAQAARVTHGEAGWFARRGEFPNATALEWPLSRESERTMRGGAPWLMHYLPFWIANLIDRMWLVLLSIVAVLIPLSRIVPPLYEFRVRSRIFRWYGRLRRIEEELAAGGDVADLARRLDELDGRAGQVVVPLSHADELYALRSHIGWVREKLVRGADAMPPPPGADRNAHEAGSTGAAPASR